MSSSSASWWSLLGSLDADCALHVLSFLPADDLVRQRAVCRSWSAVASCDTLWRPHFLRLFGPTQGGRGGVVDEEEAGDRPVSHRFPYYASTRQQDMQHPGELGLSDDDDDAAAAADHLAASAARRLNLSRLPFPSLGDHDDEEEGGDDDDDGDDGDVWRSVERRNGEIAAASEALGREIARVRELAKVADAGGGGGSGWCYRYAGACRRMPRLVAPAALASPFKEIGRGVSAYKTDRLEVSVVALPHYPVTTVRYRLHRLAVILALLNVNEYVPRPSHTVRIGFVDNNCTISLARFCLAFLRGKEKQLVDELGLGPRDKATMDTTSEAWRRYGWRAKEPTLCPNVAGQFTPFVHFLSGPFGRKAPCVFPYPDHCANNPHTFGSEDDVVAAFSFRTPEKGWAPGFLNASFTWFTHASITTLYDHAQRHILVLKAREKELVG